MKTQVIILALAFAVIMAPSRATAQTAGASAQNAPDPRASNFRESDPRASNFRASDPRASAFRAGNPDISPPAHDPVMIHADSAWYLFYTGWGISEWTSPDRIHWRALPPVFATPPAWTKATIPGFKGHFWAPDISYNNGVYYLYYAVSAFGKNTSAIGLATAASPTGPWTDKGLVVQSIPGRDLWNAIDPNLAVDEKGTPWLAFGSFWDGIKLVRLTEDRTAVAGSATSAAAGATTSAAAGTATSAATGAATSAVTGTATSAATGAATSAASAASQQAPPTDGINAGSAATSTAAATQKTSPTQQWYTIASRPRDPGLNDTLPGNGAIEAPFIFKKGRFYYLFVSWDYCCRAEKSDYKIVVGRSENITGPYLDKQGKPMTQGGGSIVLEGDSNWYGVGHNAVVTDNDVDWIVFHGYDAHDKAKAKLRQEKLTWVEEWPVVVKQ